jgi:hypothetical protein
MAACAVVPLRLERMSSLPPSCCILALIPGDADTQAEWPAGLAAVRPVDPVVEAMVIVADEQMRLFADVSQIDRDASCRCAAMRLRLLKAVDHVHVRTHDRQQIEPPAPRWRQ